MYREKYKDLFRLGNQLGKTSSISQVKNNSITFARTEDHLKKVINTDRNIHVLVSNTIDPSVLSLLPENVVAHKVDDDVQYVFTYLHNWINKDKKRKENIIGKNCNIHPSVILDVPGHAFVFGPDGKRIDLKHMGNVVIGDEVDIDALSIVHISGMDSTIIGDRTKICVKCNIGHNCVVGKDNFFAPGVLLAGGTKIGNNCYIWQGVITRSYVSVCDNVIIGAGAVVMKDITEPGVYYGAPARYIKPYDPKIR
jgi:acetyltransferase-like isoleucine patch superfamily enzyme